MTIEPSGTEVDPAIDHAIETMLRERLGGESAPDLVERILACSERERVRAAWRATEPRRRARVWLVAALLLACVTIVITVASMQGEVRGPARGESVRVEPDTFPAFLDLLSHAERASLRVEFTLNRRRIPLSGSSSDDENTDAVFPLEVLLVGLRDAEPVEGSEPPEAGPGRLRITLTERRYIEAVCGHEDGRLYVFGLGELALPRRLDRQLREVLGGSERRRRDELGVVFGGEELANLPATVNERPRTRLVGVELTAADLRVLCRRFPALNELDLSRCDGLGGEGLFRVQQLVELRLLRVPRGAVNEEWLAELRQKLPGCRVELSR